LRFDLLFLPGLDEVFDMNTRYCKGINIADLAEVGVTGRISLGLCKRREREEVKVVDKRKHSFLILELFFLFVGVSTCSLANEGGQQRDKTGRYDHKRNFAETATVRSGHQR
jgi:hypothetical protein